MEVRLKKHCYSLVSAGPHHVVDESPLFYICDLREKASVGPTALSKEHWEPVPKVAWHDVTDECVFDPVNGQIIRDVPGGSRIVVMGDGDTNMWEGYRLQKIQFPFPVNICNSRMVSAFFLVERKDLA